jgi:hypothetical protein
MTTPSLADLQYPINRYQGGDLNAYRNAYTACDQLAEHYPEAAATMAQVLEGQRVGQKCDLEHLPARYTTPKEFHEGREFIERAEQVLAWLAEAGIPRPDPSPCIHGKMI